MYNLVNIRFCAEKEFSQYNSILVRFFFRILLLDEATSALDSASEACVQVTSTVLSATHNSINFCRVNIFLFMYKLYTSHGARSAFRSAINVSAFFVRTFPIFNTSKLCFSSGKIDAAPALTLLCMQKYNIRNFSVYIVFSSCFKN
jgi:hypothetical protein